MKSILAVQHEASAGRARSRLHCPLCCQSFQREPAALKYCSSFSLEISSFEPIEEQAYLAAIYPRSIESSREKPSRTKLERKPTARLSPAPFVSMTASGSDTAGK